MNKSDLSYLTLAAKDAEDSIVNRQQERFENCCKSWGNVRDQMTGKGKMMPQRCKQWWRCENCLGVEVQKYKDRILRALDSGKHVAMVHVDNEAAAESIIDELEKDDYLRTPQSNGSLIVKYTCESGDENEITAETLDTINWAEIVMNKDRSGKRASGGLGKVSKSKGSKGKVEIHHEIPVTSAPLSVAVRAEKLAQEDTNELDPHSDYELEEANRIRNSAYEQRLNEFGYKVSEWLETKSLVDLTSIGWFIDTKSANYDNYYAQKMENDRRLIAVLGG
jgi:hypothetical protein